MKRQIKAAKAQIDEAERVINKVIEVTYNHQNASN
jgi:hypothetical protein